MSRKSNLLKFKNISAGDMSATSITSAVTNIEHLDNIGLQFTWTGSPVGTFAVQVSVDHAQDINDNVTVAGNWTPVPLAYLSGGSMTTATSIPASVGSPIYVDLTQLSAPWIRVVYTKISGTGTLTGYVTAKTI